VDDTRLRYEIYKTFAETGEAPDAALLAEWAGGPAAAESALRRLHEAHALVLDDSGAIRMALPFAAVATDHQVGAGDDAWWANCAWDALAIPAALEVDVHIEARWLDTGETVALDIAGGEPISPEGFVHFAVPARHWWDDIVET
jgi:hypothetical protein